MRRSAGHASRLRRGRAPAPFTAFVTAALCATALAVAGCGGGSSESSKAGSASTANGSASATGSTTATKSAAATGTHRASGRHGAQSAPTATTKVSGKVLLPTGTMQLGSPAFPLGGAIPKRYTCDGGDVSPPLRWSHVPKGAAELFLFVLDENSVSAEGGIRWVVGGIDPRSHGVAAGALPPGAIVGRNTGGGASWGGICPGRGQTHLITIVLYALHRKIPLSAGFMPAEAEQHFAGNTFASAETYGRYARPR